MESKIITNTYKRIRESFYWPSLQNEVQDYARTRGSGQAQTLVCITTSEEMLIADTYVDAFDNIFLDAVGRLQTIPRRNKHTLTMQDNFV